MLNFFPRLSRKCVANILAHVPFLECKKVTFQSCVTKQVIFFFLVSPIDLISSLLVQFLSALLWDIKHCDVCFDHGDDQNGKHGQKGLLWPLWLWPF